MKLETYLRLREEWKSWRQVIEEVRGYKPEAITKQVDNETFVEWVVRGLSEEQVALDKMIDEKGW